MRHAKIIGLEMNPSFHRREQYEKDNLIDTYTNILGDMDEYRNTREIVASPIHGKEGQKI